VSPLARRRLQTLEREVRHLVGRDISLSADWTGHSSVALTLDDEVNLLLKVLAAANVGPFERAAYVGRLKELLKGRP
jgi:hypothetical protein